MKAKDIIEILSNYPPDLEWYVVMDEDEGVLLVSEYTGDLADAQGCIELNLYGPLDTAVFIAASIKKKALNGMVFGTSEVGSEPYKEAQRAKNQIARNLLANANLAEKPIYDFPEASDAFKQNLKNLQSY